MLLPPPLPFSTAITAEPTKAGCQSRPAGTCVVEKAWAAWTLCECQKRGAWRAEGGRGGCSGAGRASSAGKWPCWRHLQSVGTVRAEVCLPSQWWFFFFHLSNGKFLCDNLFLLLILACIPISALAITVHSAFKNPSLPCTRTSKSWKAIRQIFHLCTIIITHKWRHLPASGFSSLLCLWANSFVSCSLLLWFSIWSNPDSYGLSLLEI